MKSTAVMALSVLLSFSLIGCGSQISSISAISPSPSASQSVTPIAVSDKKAEPLITSYYEGQSSRAFKMIQKSIFKNLINGWTDKDLKGLSNPKWNFDTFARYQILDHDMVSVSKYKELYYCTFTADNNVFGYVVVSYDGDSLAKISLQQTPYLFDLNANITDLTAKLSKTELDFSTAVATRVQLADTKKNRSDPIIRVTDGKGHSYICYFGEKSMEVSSGIMAEAPAAAEFTVKNNQITEGDRGTAEEFAKSFINLYNGAVAEQNSVSFESYISNENLLAFANSALELEQKQQLRGGIGVIFGGDNKFNDSEFKILDKNLCYLKLKFSNKGSGAACQMLIQSRDNKLEIADFYFGGKGGADTIATGHSAVRKVDNPNIWNDKKWVKTVFKNLEDYETKLNGKP